MPFMLSSVTILKLDFFISSISVSSWSWQVPQLPFSIGRPTLLSYSISHSILVAGPAAFLMTTFSDEHLQVFQFDNLYIIIGKWRWFRNMTQTWSFLGPRDKNVQLCSRMNSIISRIRGFIIRLSYWSESHIRHHIHGSFFNHDHSPHICEGYSSK